MADPHVVTEQRPPIQIPLLGPKQNHAENHTHQEEEEKQQQQLQQEEENEDTQLDQTLERLEKFLTFLGFNQSSWFRLVLSWTAFVFIGVLLPVLVLELSDCPDCEAYQIKNFELDIVASQACLAAVSLLCVSHNLRKYGIRRFLFVDRHSGHMLRFRNDYIKQISVRVISQASNFITYRLHYFMLLLGICNFGHSYFNLLIFMCSIFSITADIKLKTTHF